MTPHMHPSPNKVVMQCVSWKGLPTAKSTQPSTDKSHDEQTCLSCVGLAQLDGQSTCKATPKPQHHHTTPTSTSKCSTPTCQITCECCLPSSDTCIVLPMHAPQNALHQWMPTLLAGLLTYYLLTYLLALLAYN